MTRFVCALALLLPLIGTAGTVTGYLPHYRAGTIHALPYEVLSDVIFFSVEPRADGSIDFSDAKPAILKKLTTLAKPKGVKVRLCVGGWGKSAGFPKMAAAPSTRIAFARNLVAYLRKHQLDGADLDWEHPQSKADIKNFHTLIVDLKKAFDPHGFELTVAVAGWGTYLKPETLPFVDAVHVMAYDQGTPHASFEGMKRDLSRWKKIAPREKLVVGLPFYGRNAGNKAMTYEDIVRRFKPAPDSDLAGGYHFNGPATIRKKAEYVRKEGLGGVMIWELGQDAKGKHSLLRAIDRKVD